MSASCQKLTVRTIPHTHLTSDIINFTSEVSSIATDILDSYVVSATTETDPVFTTWANTYSANYQSTYNSYNTQSGNLLTYNSGDVRYVNLSGDVMTGGLSAPSLSTGTLYVGASTINFVDDAGNIINSLKSLDIDNYNSNYTIVSVNSALWSSITGSSANNASVYNTVNTNSADWIGGGSDVSSLSSNWENTYSTVGSYSATWGGGGSGGAYLPLSGGTMDHDAIISFDNYSRIRQNPNGSDNGIDLVCSIDYVHRWKDGFLYIYDQSNQIRTVYYGRDLIPGVNYDSSQGYIVGSVYVQDNGNSYICDDNSVGSSVWEIWNTVGNYLPLSGGTLIGAVSTTNVLYTTGGNSNQWNNTYSMVQTNSANWNYQGTDIKSISSNWENTYNTVNTNSADWNYQGTDVKSISSNWENTYNVVQINSSQWSTDNISDTGVRELTSNWQSSYNTVNSNSAVNWNYQGTDIKSISSNWENTYIEFSSQSANNTSVYNVVNSNSSSWGLGGGVVDNEVRSLTANWENTYTGFGTQSANNISVYSKVNTNSADWNYQGTDVKDLTANWQNTYTSFSTQSANNISVYSTVQSNSATWTGGGGGSDVSGLSANWQNTYTSFSTQSANNISVYSTTNSNSAIWLNNSYDELWIGAGAMLAPTLSGATAATMPITATSNEIYIDSFTFDAGATKYTQFDASLPSNCNKQSIKAKFSWTTTTSAAVGDIVWGIQARILSDTNTIDGGWGTAQECIDTISGNTTFQVSSSTAVLGLSGTSSADALLLFRVYRNASAAADNLAVNASLYGVKLQYSLAGSLSSSW